uniref:Uncharacterized protein n=1 Tax=Avena sativa TaxID=4498 RepID=A0ACD5X0H8_AVESA
MAPAATSSATATGPVSVGGDGTSGSLENVKVWCSRCQVASHMTRECTVQHYYCICDKHNHSTWHCQVLKQPKPVITMMGSGHANTLFYSLPDSLFRDNLAQGPSTTALISVTGEGTISVVKVQDQIARLCPTQKQWTWEAVPNGDKAFKISIPSQEDMGRIDGMEFMVRMNKVMMSISAWRMDHIDSAFELQQVWVHVTGVPHELRHFLGLCGVGSLIGQTLDIDMFSLRRRAKIRILVGMIDTSAFLDDSSEYSLFASNLVVKLKGYEFRYELEPHDYVPKTEFHVEEV